MPLHRQSWFEGWRLFVVLTLVLIVLSIWIAGMRQFEVDGVRMVIRFTARASLLFFCLAFGAGALAGVGVVRADARAVGAPPPPALRGPPPPRVARDPRRCDRLLRHSGSHR